MRVTPVFGTVVMGLLLGSGAYAQVEFVEAKPLASVVKAKPGAVQGGAMKVPLITWGADVATILANGGRTTASGSPFAAEGLKVELFKEDDFTAQLEGYIQGKTPYLRGTLGMINQASELLSSKPGLQPVIIYQLSWSSGGDTLTVRSGIKRPADLKGKTVVLQRYGPHVDYLDRILRDAGLSFSDVKVKWVAELTAPDRATKGAVDPASAMRADSSIDAVLVITPDALALTSGGTTGTGAEDSVKGAKILLSTKTADRVIADVYAVRRDWFDSHRGDVQKFVHALLVAEEQLEALRDKKGAAHDKAMRQAAEILLGSPQAMNDIGDLLGDCTLAGYPGNVKFFGDTEVRNFSRMTNDIQDALQNLKLISRKVPLEQAKWDWQALAAGLKNTEGVTVPRFETAKVEKTLAERAAKGVDSGVLFEFEVRFSPNQSDFSTTKYGGDFQRAIELASTYGGAIVEIVGHADPLGYLKQKKGGATKEVLKRVEQSAKNLSLSRANGVRDGVMKYARQKGYTLDASQFAVAGYGFSNAVHPVPKTEEQWLANMRVAFRIINVEAELTEFEALQ